MRSKMSDPDDRDRSDPLAEHLAKLAFKVGRIIEQLENRTLLNGTDELNAAIPASMQNLSEYMVGTVLVNVVLMESNGRFDADTETWTAGQIARVKSEINEGLGWWESLNAKMTNGHQDLHFITDFTYANSPVPTRYEPINRPHTDENLWIDDFLSAVGYNSAYDYRVDVARYDNARRSAVKTDWVTTVFVVNSDHDKDGAFADSRYFAYACVGGPFLVMNYKNDGWGIDKMGQVLAHEMGHIFYALDEYPQSNSYNDRSGYDNIQNLNAADGNPNPSTRVDSIMAEADRQNRAYANLTSSPTSLKMIGWQDSDRDGIFDVLDVPLALTGTGSYNVTTGRYQFTGESWAQALINSNPRSGYYNISVNKVNRLLDSVDGAAWETAVSGASMAGIDASVGPFPRLAQGLHSIRFMTVDDSSGVTSNVLSDTFVVQIPDQGDTLLAAQGTGLGPGASQGVYVGAIGDGLYLDKDVDLFSFHADAGSYVNLVTDMALGGQSADTMLRLFDGAGHPLASDDDSGRSRYSRIFYRVPTTGTYYVGVSGYQNDRYDPTRAGSAVSGQTGDYVLTIGISPRRPQDDYDGDGVTDPVVFEPSTSTFYIAGSSYGNGSLQFGRGTLFGGHPIAIPADYDGDGVTDPAVFEPSTATFYLARSRDGNIARQFGQGTLFGGHPIPLPQPSHLLIARG